ncbi:biopolymer transporter ExbD [Thalassotalea ponticola]|uniref:ExbD/TolR family protein n=1 Tax=Thalassotalea ponticola TaxID=1523392 RepID=UPI0025B2DA3E|nr:biopolymer transporter ExbD [Thalassotalea ponticola]MDN3652684.1 biopolymer transporter ExbD [Thalassotalea ponticola]
MKQSVRAKRMARHHQRLSKTSKLSLVSLMDIFTILVFFLMVNASDVQVLQNSKEIELPKSVSKKAAEENLIITVNANSVLIQGRKVASIDQLKDSEAILIDDLLKELEYQRNRRADLTEEELANGLAINIMADKSVPYSLLKKIMQTSANAGYTNISLAVEQTYGVSEKELLSAAENGQQAEG